ncbi:MAG: family 16 glycoside hydrolase [Planctomycetaceae bacterium]
MLSALAITIACAATPPQESPAREVVIRTDSLSDWDGNPKFWRVEDGTLVGQTTKDNPTKGNTFLVWRGGYVDNFELELEYKIVGGNSGIQYRSFEPGQKWVVGGYQADFEAGKRFSGILYGERFRGILANRGKKTELTRDGKYKSTVVGDVGDSEEIQSRIKNEDWNTYRIVANGYHFQHFINGVKTCECTDNDITMRRAAGVLALQLHAGPPMKVQFRNIKLKRLPAKKKIVFIAGTKSHGYGSHEHKAGCMLLADALNKSGLPVETTVVTQGWPKDESVLDDADAIVIYCDGGGRHPFNKHLDRLKQLTARGTGIACIHYGVETVKGAPGKAFMNMTGGYFEPHWSVNPHWVADYKALPKHPIANGVKPFAINDEWYYHMRFLDGMPGVTPILTDLPPETTLKRRDGAHSGNPHVRKAVANKEAQHMAWARQRPDAGRGFGFTGGHYHWNWGHNQFRKLVLNAIAWTAHLDVPEGGVKSSPVTLEELKANQDYEPNDRFNPERINALLQEWNAE